MFWLFDKRQRSRSVEDPTAAALPARLRPEMPGEQLFLHVWKLHVYLQTLLALHWIFELLSPSCLSVPEDLSLEERDELSNIRRRKRELLDDIEVCVCVCVFAVIFH